MEVELPLAESERELHESDQDPLTDDDPLGVHDFATHVVPLVEAPHAYEIFQKMDDGAIKVLLQP